MRFLTALVRLGHGRYRLDGVARMRERPIEDLLLRSRQLGVRADSEAGNGCPPVVIESERTGWTGAAVRRFAATSAASSLAACSWSPHSLPGPLGIRLEGPLVSRPYVEMTLRHDA